MLGSNVNRASWLHAKRASINAALLLINKQITHTLDTETEC